MNDVGRKADELLDTRAGISIANYAWQEGYTAGKKFAIRDERFLSPNPVPENPYSALHLRMIAADKRAEKEGTDGQDD